MQHDYVKISVQKTASIKAISLILSVSSRKVMWLPIHIGIEGQENVNELGCSGSARLKIRLSCRRTFS